MTWQDYNGEVKYKIEFKILYIYIYSQNRKVTKAYNQNIMKLTAKHFGYICILVSNMCNA